MSNVTLEAILRGVALGDSIGYPLEFIGRPTNADFTGSLKASILRVSDDTQMSMFLAEALFVTPGDINEEKLTNAYLRWLKTQDFDPQIEEAKTNLLAFPEMFASRAPGRTCMGSLTRLARTGVRPTNNSKGNGTVMRCLPIAWLAFQELGDFDAIRLSAMDARITHDHPFAAQCSALAATAGYYMLKGADFKPAFEDAMMTVAFRIGLDPYVQSLVTKALSGNRWNGSKLGGWVAEEALALAIAANVRSNSFLEVIERASCIVGDSDTVAAIAGGLAALRGWEVPNHSHRIDVEEPLVWLVGACN